MAAIMFFRVSIRQTRYQGEELGVKRCVRSRGGTGIAVTAPPALVTNLTSLAERVLSLTFFMLGSGAEKRSRSEIIGGT